MSKVCIKKHATETLLYNATTADNEKVQMLLNQR